ncbi:hypothetical protein ACET3X_007633 [Alternaria dauci]|uniref:Zn(2)-C6 fungal-type domain-containing protein n=1 Tax=Alternaria dauci TaxID=48095 RepID=A0ABR3UCI1_9PLEO
MTKTGENKATRQCWECLKRRLVCDNTLPHCIKCQKAGRQCSGYDDAKPLQWIQPGKVTSRRRRKKDGSSPKIYTVESTASSERRICQGASAPEQKLRGPLHEEDYIGEPVDYKAALSAWAKDRVSHPGDRVTDLHALSFKMTESAKEAARIFQICGRAKIEEIVASDAYDEAAKLLRSNRNPLQRLKRLLQVLRLQNVPIYGDLVDETSEVVQAVQYYNLRIHTSYKAAGELAPNPVLVPFPQQALHLLTPAIHHTLVCLALNHYIHTLPLGTDRSVLAPNRWKVYHHRGAALRALGEYIGQDKTRCSDMTITTILMFMCLELQNPTFADWRSHVHGMKQIVDLRGGPKKLRQEAPHLIPSLVLYVLIVSMANTCSPSWDQVEMSSTADDVTDDIMGIYSLIFPYTLCPPELFTEILCVNRLRAKASAAVLECDFDADHTLQAYDLLARIETFSVEDWAQAGTLYTEWVTVGTVYKAAVALYATLSLGSLTVLPADASLLDIQTAYSNVLLGSLRTALETRRIARFMAWPLVVVGVEAIYRGEATRSWIEARLEDLSRMLGTSGPLKARSVLRRYWKGGVAGWDECFDRPYVFVM